MDSSARPRQGVKAGRAKTAFSSFRPILLVLIILLGLLWIGQSIRPKQPQVHPLPSTVFTRGQVFSIMPSVPQTPAIRTVEIQNGTKLTFPIRTRKIRGLSVRIRQDTGHEPIYIHVPTLGLRKDPDMAPRTIQIEKVLDTPEGKCPLSGRWNPGSLRTDKGPYEPVLWERQDK